MPALFATAPAKTILFGEHAVVYGQPAIAVPVESLKTKVSILANPLGKADEVTIIAPNIGLNKSLDQLGSEHPITIVIQELIILFKIDHLPSCNIKITSSIPIASGLGSSASTAVAIIRALSSFLGFQLPNDQINSLAYKMEKVLHGNPSGIDNSVITYQKPIYFIQDHEPFFLNVNKPLHLVIADTGIKSLTKDVVLSVRAKWLVNQEKFEDLFKEIGKISESAKHDIEIGDLKNLGNLMQQNHSILQQMDVSCLELDQLVKAAIQAGALGAKLCGSGRGGNMVALINQKDFLKVKQQLIAVGAVRVFHTIIKNNDKTH